MVDFCSDDRQIELDFSRKYTDAHARQYQRKHHDGVMRRISHWREEQLAKKALALAGNPASVLDLPCGAGRFWPLLCEQTDRLILAADYSDAMLATACAAQPQAAARIRTFQTSAFDIALPDAAVDCVFCIRLLHHVAASEHRLAMLAEFYRVARESVIVSLWVDGNVKAWRRSRLDTRRAQAGRASQNRYVVARKVIESEFAQAGFGIAGRLDFLPGYSQWRTYVLKKR